MLLSLNKKYQLLIKKQHSFSITKPLVEWLHNLKIFLLKNHSFKTDVKTDMEMDLVKGFYDCLDMI